MTKTKREPKHIFLMGLTSTSLGGMEYHNLGNYIIMEPFIEELHREFSQAEIATSIQMSDSFCHKYHVLSIRNKRFWTYGYYTASRTAIDILKVLCWKVLKVAHVDFKKLLRSSALLSELDKADFVIDFSGDIYGDNAPYRNFIESNARLIFAMILNKTTAMLIGSPGPFTKTWRLLLAKAVMSKLDLITNRESVSTDFLEFIGIRGAHVVSAACPSVLFKKDESQHARAVLAYETLTPKVRPTVGLVVCGWNMLEGPHNKWPRRNDEYEPFIRLIDHLIDNLGLRVCVMSHQNSTDGKFNLTRGSDHRLIEQLMSNADRRHGEDKLFTLKSLYTASMSKTIIGQFDMLMSGRIHGAVQGMSQAIPTAIIDYGHEPKAHKLRGFAKLYDVEDYVCDPTNADQMIIVASRLWENREAVRQKLQMKIPQVADLAMKNFSMLRLVYEQRNP